jgi:hypothetical protein
MERETMKVAERLRELNKRFLEEIEAGKSWEDLKGILADMKYHSKRLENFPVQLVSFENDSFKDQ